MKEKLNLLKKQLDSSNIYIINSLRGLSALSVCLFHFIYSTFIQDETLRSIFFYGQKGVQVFFIISGIVIPMSLINSNYNLTKVWKFLLVRFVRIEPPYLVAVALGVIYLNVRNFIPSSSNIDVSPSLRDITLHLGYLVPFVEGAQWISKVFWTLSIEFQYYIYLALFIPLGLSSNKMLKVLFFVTLAVLPFVTNEFYFFPHWASFFAMGIIFVFWIKEKINTLIFIMLFVLYSVIIVIKQGFLDYSIALMTLFVVFRFGYFKTKVGEFFGQISYSLYLFHTLVGLSFINLMSSRVTSSVGKFTIVCTAIALSIVFSYIAWKLIEKPSQLYAKKLKGKLDL
jgi:peptidoglycan/LPS O-acetylase OafA/YrhL